jgi:hypothetical protein
MFFYAAKASQNAEFLIAVGLSQRQSNKFTIKALAALISFDIFFWSRLNILNPKSDTISGF